MRIITGSARGARLKTPKGMTTRPTADRVKGSLFNIIGRMFAGGDVDVLDVFAGTGNLGLEALSRGARSATFVDKATQRIIADNAEHTHLSDRARIYGGDVFAVMARLLAGSARFGLVFADPPYHVGLWQRTLKYLDGAGAGLLADGALIVIEHGVAENELPELMTLERVRNEKYGRTTQLSFFRRRQDGAPSDDKDDKIDETMGEKV